MCKKRQNQKICNFLRWGAGIGRDLLCLLDGVSVFWRSGAGNQTWQSHRSERPTQHNFSSLLIRLHLSDCLLVVYISSVCVLRNCRHTSRPQTFVCPLVRAHAHILKMNWWRSEWKKSVSQVHTFSATRTHDYLSAKGWRSWNEISFSCWRWWINGSSG